MPGVGAVGSGEVLQNLIRDRKEDSWRSLQEGWRNQHQGLQSPLGHLPPRIKPKGAIGKNCRDGDSLLGGKYVCLTQC